MEEDLTFRNYEVQPEEDEVCRDDDPLPNPG